MAPLIPSAKATLSYPLYACDFDPLDSTRLVVGGGGGAGRSGVGNKITVLDTSQPSELEEIVEIDLSKDEDNVTSLAVGQRKGKATPVFAGVNSSASDLDRGENAHFRVFGIEAAAAGKGKGKAKSSAAANKITEISRSKLFKGTEKDAYQRLIRLSKPFPNQPQLGGITTGMAKDAELILFETSATSPPITRGSIQSNREPVDLDFIQTGDKAYLFAYCNEHEIYVKTIDSKTDAEEPTCVYVTPFSDSFEKPTVPKFRALRWLTKDLMVALTNIHSTGGVVLQVFRLPPSGKGHCRIVQSLRLPSNIRKATGLAVSNLTQPLSPTGDQGYTQFVIAVAAQDLSISLFKLDLQVEAKVSLTTKIKPFRTFKAVHPQPITGITFSNFTPPEHPVTASTPPQHLKLASVGASNTVVVHTLPLFPVPLSVKKGQSKTPRYVVALPSEALIYGTGIVFTIIVACLSAIMVQSFLEIRGSVAPFLHASKYVPINWQEAIGKPYVFPADYNKQASGHSDASDDNLPPFFEALKVKDGEGIVVVRDTPDAKGGVEAQLHDEDVHGPHSGKTWEELGHEQKEGWKKKLTDAGHWAEGMGETILKGVVFGELAGAVGQAVGGG